MLKHLRRAAGAALLGLAAAITASPVSAAIVTGRWDPSLPQGVFPGLGWTTTINLQVSNDCTSGAVSLPYIVDIFGSSFGCKANPFAATSPFSILSAQVGIYNLSNAVIEDVLTFNVSSFTPILLNLGTGGAITYLLSLTDSNPVRGGIPSDGNYDFKLSLPGSTPAIKYEPLTGGGFITATAPPTQTDFTVNYVASPDAVIAATSLKVGQTVFTDVPEPGSRALVWLALGAAGIASSRRRRHDT